MSLGFKSQSVGVRANLCDDRTVDIWSMYSRTLLDILFVIWGQTVAVYKMLSFHLSINVIIIVVSFKILDLCPIALFQKLWNTLYISVFKSGGKQELNSSSKFLIGNRFHVKLPILSPEICKQSLRLKMRNFMWSRFSITNLLIDSLLTPTSK